jgi:hypothetical protein
MLENWYSVYPTGVWCKRARAAFLSVCVSPKISSDQFQWCLWFCLFLANPYIQKNGKCGLAEACIIWLLGSGQSYPKQNMEKDLSKRSRCPGMQFKGLLSTHPEKGWANASVSTRALTRFKDCMIEQRALTQPSRVARVSCAKAWNTHGPWTSSQLGIFTEHLLCAKAWKQTDEENWGLAFK